MTVLKLDCKSKLIIDEKQPIGDTGSLTYNRMHDGTQITTDRRCTGGRFL